MAATLPELALKSSILESPEPSVTPTPKDPIQALQKQAVGLGEEMTKERKELKGLQAESLKKEQELVKPAIAKVKEAVEKPRPPEPVLKDEPKAPDLTARSFLSGEGKNALQEVVQGLGLIITSIAGAKRAPQAALGALTGAMTGWAEGDAERASRAWHQYEGQVATMNRENSKALQQWERARVIRADDIQAQQILLTANLSEAHLSDHVMDLKEKGIEGLGRQLTQTENILAKIMTSNERVRHDIEMEDLRRESIEAQKSRPTVTEIVDPNDPTKTIKINARTGEKIGDSPKWSHYGQVFRTQESLMKFFTSGRGGIALAANNTAINHLALLEDYAKALQTGDQRTLNRLSQAVTKEFGLSSAPTTFDAIRRIASAEVVKTVAANGGGVEERKEEASDLDKSLAPDVLVDVIQSKRQILRGKTDALRLQYENMNLQDTLGPFDRWLSPQAKGEKTPPPVSLPSGVPTGSTQIGTAKGKPVYQTPDGKRVVVE